MNIMTGQADWQVHFAGLLGKAGDAVVAWGGRQAARARTKGSAGLPEPSLRCDCEWHCRRKPDQETECSPVSIMAGQQTRLQVFAAQGLLRLQLLANVSGLGNQKECAEVEVVKAVVLLLLGH